jgi:hypothetical protein
MGRRLSLGRTLVQALVRALALVLLLAALTVPGAGQARTTTYLTAHPASIDFGNKKVGDEYFKRTKITNVSDQPVRLLVYAGLPDDFGFGLLPGSTCPVLDGGAVVAPRESCYAVVRFTPTEFFVGWPAEGEMWADAFDPTTGVVLEHHLIPVTGMAVL